jgi:hypothetical protein
MEMTDHTAPAGIDLDSLPRYDHRGALLVPDQSGDYLFIDDVRQALARRAAQAAPAADERAQFEAAWRKRYQMPDDLPFAKFVGGQYDAPAVDDAFTGWKLARAALAQQSSHSIAHPIGQVSPAIDHPVCDNCDGKGGWKTGEWTDPVSGPECSYERCEVCMGSGIVPADAVLLAHAAVTPSDATGKAEDPRIAAFYKLRDIAERNEDAESANIIQHAIADSGKADAANAGGLPEPYAYRTDLVRAESDLYTAAQMRSYGADCVRRAAASEGDLSALFNAEVDAEYPIPDNPHASVIRRATDNRAAMWRGINAACKLLRRQSPATSAAGQDAAVAAIEFALRDDDGCGMDFLRCWNEGDFDAIRNEWPEAPEAVFIGADPLHPMTKFPATSAADAKDAEREAIATAYGYLWHVNAADGAPPEAEVLSVTPKRAAYEARKALRDLLTHEQRGKGINDVRAHLAAMAASRTGAGGQHD